MKQPNGILMHRRHAGEDEIHRHVRRRQRQSRSMIQIARAVVTAEAMLRRAVSSPQTA